MAGLISTGIWGFICSATMKGGQMVSTFVSGLSGWMIDKLGNAEFKTIYCRDKFVTNEFVYNRIRVTEDEEIISSSMKIASSLDNGDGTHTVYPDLREGDINPLSNGDLLAGYYHNPANSGVIYAIQKFTVQDDPAEDQSITLEAEGESIPYQHMIIVRVGNTTDEDRQSFIRISSRTNCQYFYDGINSWTAYDDPDHVKCVLGKADIGLIPAWAVDVIGAVKKWFGLIADGVILRGIFILKSSGKTIETELNGINTTITDVETRFEVKEGQIAASVKKVEVSVTNASNAASFCNEAANAANGILKTVKESEASINLTAEGIATKVGEITTQVNAATDVLESITEKEASMNQTVEGFESTVTETTSKAVTDAVTGAAEMIEEKVGTAVTQSAREWKVEVMGSDAEGNPNTILAAINASEEGIKIKGDKVEITGTLLAQIIMATGLNVNDKFTVDKDGKLTAVDGIFNGTVYAAGFIQKQPTVITPENISEYVIPDEFGDLDFGYLNLEKSGTFVIFKDLPGVPMESTVKLPGFSPWPHPEGDHVIDHVTEEVKERSRRLVGNKIIIYNAGQWIDSCIGITGQLSDKYGGSNESFVSISLNRRMFACLECKCDIGTGVNTNGREMVYWEYVLGDMR